MSRRWISTAAAAFRLVLGLVFVAAALLKWFDPAGQSTYYGNLAHAAPVVGWVIIIGELLLGAWPITGIRAGLAAGVALFVLAMFSGAIVADMLARHPVPCGCFGAAWRRPTARQLSSTAWPSAWYGTWPS